MVVVALAAIAVFAHGERGSHEADLNVPPSVERIADEEVYGGRHVVWAHAVYNSDWDQSISFSPAK